MELPEFGLSFDEEGNARLVVDETLAVNVSRNAEEGRLMLAFKNFCPLDDLRLVEAAVGRICCFEQLSSKSAISCITIGICL